MRWWNFVQTDTNKCKISNLKERSKKRLDYENSIKETKDRNVLKCHLRRERKIILDFKLSPCTEYSKFPPLSPVIANFFMEDFEKEALELAAHKPVCWYRYVDDTFAIWLHGRERLTQFLDHLNGLHNNIKFTMEIEGQLPFLDIDIHKKKDGSLGHKVYRKPTHTNVYLNQLSHHHPANKHSILFSLIHRAKTLCDQDSLAQELEFLTTVFKKDG